MKYFTTVHDVKDPETLVKEAITLKKDPFAYQQLGKNKTLGLIFLNPSLRTRLSTQKAAQHLGMNVMVMNIDKEGWALEFEDGAVMNGNKAEHIKDAAGVIGSYCDVVGLRSFPSLINKKEDYSEYILLQFMKHCSAPMISLESATLHPLQSLADAMTIAEYKKKSKPKVVLTWAPHIKPLPQAVANSFSEWMLQGNVEFVIAHPKGYELCEDFVKSTPVFHNQEEALKDADFVYVKNWSSFNDYGKILPVSENWLLNKAMLNITNKARLMHCLPVRRNVELSDELLDGPASLVQKQAENRVFAAQAVLKRLLETKFAKQLEQEKEKLTQV
jgi:N-succinyl-L-ornithine transcarbamylase